MSDKERPPLDLVILLILLGCGAIGLLAGTATAWGVGTTKEVDCPADKSASFECPAYTKVESQRECKCGSAIGAKCNCSSSLVKVWDGAASDANCKLDVFYRCYEERGFLQSCYRDANSSWPWHSGDATRSKRICMVRDVGKTVIFVLWMIWLGLLVLLLIAFGVQQARRHVTL